MSGPVTFAIQPISDLEIDVNFDQVHENPRKGIPYALRNVSSQGFRIKEECKSQENYEGFLSPLTDLTLPSERRKKAGIPLDATKFAFLYPPKHLAGAIDWDDSLTKMHGDKEKIGSYMERRRSGKYKETFKDVYASYGEIDDYMNMVEDYSDHPSVHNSPEDSAETEGKTYAFPKRFYLACLAVQGAYVYFKKSEDEQKVYEPISFNILCFQKEEANYELIYDGPYEAPKFIINELRRLDRFQVLPLQRFHEFNYIAYAWILPHEFDTVHGCFIYLNQDGTAIKYRVRSANQSIDPGQPIEVISDVIDPHSFDMNLVIDDNYLESFVYPAKNLKFDNLERLKSDDNAKKVMAHYGWNYLHYACCFCSQEIELIKDLLKTEFGEAKPDKFGRYPLHLACSSNASLEIIQALLKVQEHKETICKTTYKLRRLPINGACNRDTPIEVIEKLLENDKDKESIVHKTAIGRQLLHEAIEQKVEKEVIVLLLQAGAERSQKMKKDGKKETRSIRTKFKEMYPLHIACWKGSSEVVELLLSEADKKGLIIHKPVSMAEYLRFDDKTQFIVFNGNKAVFTPLPSNDSNEETPISDSESNRIRSKTPNEEIPESDGKSNGTIGAIHIALLTKLRPEIIKLLLDDELEFKVEHPEQHRDIVNFKDSAGRTPLNIACMQNYDTDIIMQLLSLDETKQTVSIPDAFGNTPFHHACGDKYANVEVIKMLFDAEDKYLQKNKRDRSADDISDEKDLGKEAVYVENENKSTPLKLAVTENAPTSALYVLLRPDRMNLDEFGTNSIDLLSERVVESKQLQDRINERLSERHSFFLFLFTLIMKTAMFVLMIITTNNLLTRGEEPNQKPTNFDMVVPYIFIVYMCIEILEELRELFNKGGQYLLQRKQVIDIARITLLSFSISILLQQKETYFPYKQTSEVYYLLWAGVLLGVDLIFALRTTFLPFAKFAGGLRVIMAALIPFFVISTIFLVGFAFAFRVFSWNQEKIDEEEEGPLLVKDCQETFMKCFLQVLDVFFNGGAEIDEVIDILFGFIIILILLTIVVAIVTDAWTSVETKASKIYWENRISHLVDINFTFSAKMMSTLGCLSLSGIGDKIDKYFVRGLFKDNIKVSWTKDAPYNQVSNLEQYNYPSKFFIKADAEKIMAAHSLHSEVYWIKRSEKGFAKRLHVYVAIANWVCYNALYCLFIIMGLFTGGLLWPTAFRRAIVSYGQSNTEEETSPDEMIENILSHMKNDSSKYSQLTLQEIEEKLKSAKQLLKEEAKYS